MVETGHSDAGALPEMAPSAEAALLADGRRIVVVGARGWIGLTALALLRETLGAEVFARRVVCFGSADATFELEDGTPVAQRAIDRLAELPPQPSLLLHLAFLTKDKVAGMDADAYVAANQALSAKVLSALDRIGVDRLFVASSGAAAHADREGAPADLRLYGSLKRDDEDRFAAWAQAEPDRRRAAIFRIYAVSGPYMNKHETYALASFIMAALAGGPIAVRAPREVFRAYVAIRELISLVFAILLAGEGPAVIRADSGGEPMELAEVAHAVSRLAGNVAVERAAITEPVPDRYYGDVATYADLLEQYGVAPVAMNAQLAETIAWFRCQSSLSGQTGG